MRPIAYFCRLRAWAKCCSFHGAEHLVELGAANVTAVHNDSRDLLCVGNIFEGVGGK